MGNFFKVVGKSFGKLGKIALIGAGTAVLAHGPDTSTVITQLTSDPKWATIFSAIFILIDAWKHRKQGE